MSDTTELLTPQEAAALLKVPVSFIYERTRKPGAIPVKRVARYVRLPKDALMEWVNGTWKPE
jgi:excisionase family DNA binding protein